VSGRRSADWPVDLTLALAAGTLNVSGGLSPDPTLAYDLGTGPLWALGCGVAGLLLWWRRSHPVAVYAAIAGLALLGPVLGLTAGFLPVSVLLAAYAVGAFASPRRGLLVLVGTGGIVAWMFVLRAPYFDSPLGIAIPVETLAAWALGASVARRNSLGAWARGRMHRLAEDEARVTDEAVREERLRLARELQGRVLTCLTDITTEAGAARRRPGPTDPVLGEIERLGREASADLARLLVALRRESAGAISAAPAVTPRSVPTKRPTALDLLFGASVAGVGVAGCVLPNPSTRLIHAAPASPSGWLLLVILAMAPGAALAVRRQLPLAPPLVTFAALLVVGLFDWQSGTLPGVLLVSLYAVGAWATLRAGAAAAALVLCGTQLAALWPIEGAEEWAVAPESLLFAAPWVVGVVIRRQRVADESAEQELEQTQRRQLAAVDRAVASERLAVARDLHDVVSHALAAITIQAAALGRTSSQAGEPVYAAARIERAGRSAVGDLRRMLALLQPDGHAAAFEPAPGLASLKALIARHRDLHGPITLDGGAELERQPDSVRVAAYRLIQEALTNAVRHAPGAPVQVAIHSTPDGLVVIVENAPAEWSGSSAPSSGLGLIGMRERAMLAGGTLDAGPTDAGGFRVTAGLSGAASR
jgi:signal transduction histidine kinase